MRREFEGVRRSQNPTTKPSTMMQNVPFGELRSMLQNARPGARSWRSSLWSLLKRAHTIDPERYAEQWLGYLEGRDELWSRCHFDLESVEALDRSAQMAPFAYFRVNLKVERTQRWSSDALRNAHTLARSRHLDRVRSLRMIESALATQVLSVLLETESLRDVTHLTMRRCELGIEDAVALATSPSVGNLRSLRLDGNRIKSRGTRALLSSEHLSGLTTLSLQRCEAGVRSLRALETSPHAPWLEQLDLGRNDLGPKGAKVLTRARTLGELRILNLEHNALRDGGARAILTAPWFGSLRVCQLGHNEITNDGVHAITNGEEALGLERLDLEGNQITGRIARALEAALKGE